MCMIKGKNIEIYIRKIKTLRKDGIKQKEKYYLNKKGIWFTLLGLNPSQSKNELIDCTNLKICNYLISNKIQDENVKGYTLINFFNVSEPNSESLKDIINLNQNKNIDKILNKIIRKGNKLILFYGRDENNLKLIYEYFSESKLLIKEIMNSNNLYITVDAIKTKKSKKETNEDYDRFVHPGAPGVKIKIRNATEEDFNDIFPPLE